MEENLKGSTASDRLTNALFIIYLLVLIWILLFKLGTQFSYLAERRVNFIPFSQPLILNGQPDFGEVILNVLIFIPLGVYAGILFINWQFKRKVFFIISASVVVEGLQYILAIGAFDITDIITNTFGGVIGLLLFMGMNKIFNSHLKAQKVINIMAVIGTSFIVVFLILLKLDMLPIRYK